MKQKDFITADLYLASAISLLLNTLPSYRVDNGKTLFIFSPSNDLYQAMNEYNNGIALNALDYAQMVKRLRAEMLMRRGMEGRNG